MAEEGIPCNRTSVIDYLRAEKRWKQLVEEHQRKRTEDHSLGLQVSKMINA